MANKKQKILEQALKMHKAAGGTYSTPEAAAKQQYANARHEIAKNYYNQYFGAMQSESLAKAGERERKEARENAELGSFQTMRTSGAERIAQAESRAARAKKDFEDYMGSDERKQRTAEQQKKQEQNRFLQHLFAGNSDIMQPEIIQDDKEIQLRKASEEAQQEAAQAKRLAPMADYLARFPADPEERSQDERTTVEALREFDQMPYADRAALESYAVNGYRDQNLPIELTGMIPTAQQEAAGLIDRYGKDKVDKMAAAYMRWQNAQLNEQVAQKTRESVDSGAGGSIGHNLASVAANVGGGVVSMLGQLQNRAMEAGVYDTVDPNAVGSAVNTYVDSVRDETFQNITGDQYDENGEKVEDGGALRQGAGYLYQAAMSAADSVARMWAAGAFGGGTALASGLAATQAFSRSMAAASANGATPAQAAISAAADATWEYLSEKLPLDKLVDMAPQKNFRAVLGNALKQAGIEIVGEEANLVASLFSQAYILKEKSDFNLQVQQYLAQGMSEEEAKKAATANIWQEAKQTAIVAGISGGVSGGAQTLTGAFGNPVLEESPLSVQQDPLAESAESAPVMPEEAAGAPETRELDVVTQAVQQAQQNREAAQNAQQEPTLAQQLTPEQRVQEAVKGVHGKESTQDGVETDTKSAIEESPSGNSKYGVTDGAENSGRAGKPMGPEGLSEGGNPFANAKPTPLPTNIVPRTGEEVNRKPAQASDNLPNGQQPVPEGMKGTGAAEQNFTGKAAYADLLQEGNVQRDRPGDVRPVEVPKKDGAGRRVTEFAGNAYGAKATPDYMANEIESLIQDGKLGFDTRSNQESLRRAADALEGNTEGVKAQITENLAHDKVQDGDIEKAMLLYVKNANSKDKADQEAAAQILVQLGKMANITGRNLHLFSMLRRMTPEGQLLYAEKSARSLVDSLNKKRGAGKKVVSRRKEQAGRALEAVKQARRQAENAVKEAGSRVRYKDGAFKVDGDPAMSKYAQKVGEALAKYAKEESGDKKPVQVAVRSALKDIGETLSSVARPSGQKKDAVEVRIVEVLVNKYNFSEPDASKVADVVKEQYRDMVKEKSKSILKTSDQIFDELANLGAFDADSEFNQAAAEKWLKTKDTYIEPELAKAYLDAKTDDEKEAALDNIYKDVASRIPATLGEKWDAWRNMAMLLNPKTHIRNMGATGSFLPFVEVKRVIGAALEKALLDEEQRTKAVLGSDKRSKALLKWAKEDAEKPKVIERLGQSGTTGDDARSKIQEHRQILPGILDKVRKGNMAAMEAEDRFFKKITYARSLASFLKARGYSETDIQGGLVPAGVLEEGRTLAIQEAQKATFNDRNKFSDSLAKLTNVVDGIHPVMAFMRKGLLPFVRTPANVVKRLTEYNPLALGTLLFTAKKDLDSGKKTAADIIDEVSAGLTGSAAMALGAALASGFVPDVELVGEATEEEKEQGAIDYSIRIGDNYYGVGWLSPTMIPLFIGATLKNAYVSAHSSEEAGVDGWDFADGLVSIGADILNPMMELSMLSSLHELGERLKNGEEAGDKAIAFFMHTVTSYFTQGLPTIFGQAEQATETEKSSTYVNTDNPTEKAIKKTLGDATRRIPGLDLYQTPRRDEWGLTIENEGSPLERVANAFFNPFTVSKRKNDPLTKEISRLNEATGEDLTPPMPARVINYTDGDGNQHKNVRLTQEQYDKLAQTQGETAKELVAALTGSDDYKAMDDEQKAASLKLAYEYAKETAEIATMDDHLGYSETWKEELNEAKKPADFILRRVSGSELNKAMSAMDTAWGHNWATDVKSKALETAYENYKAMSPAARREVEAFATGTTAKYLEARRNGISHKDFLAAAKNVETVKGTGKYNSETKKNTVKDIDKREAIAKTTGLTEHQVDIIMKAYMPDYDPDAEKKEKTELKYDYIRQELGMTPVEYADTYRAYLENAKKHEKIAAIQDLGYDYTTASKLYRLYNGKIDVVAWAGE